MAAPFSRRGFVRGAIATTGALAGLGDFGFLSRLERLSAAETKLPSGAVQFRPEIEPLVRVLETTPRENLLEEIGARIRRGLAYRDVLTALLLAGIRNVQPRPSVGFKFHAVLVVNSAHLASIQSPDEHRWLPIFWALDYFKQAQSENERDVLNATGSGCLYSQLVETRYGIFSSKIFSASSVRPPHVELYKALIG